MTWAASRARRASVVLIRRKRPIFGDDDAHHDGHGADNSDDDLGRRESAG